MNYFGIANISYPKFLQTRARSTQPNFNGVVKLIFSILAFLLAFTIDKQL